MMQYVFYAVERSASMYPYPTLMTVRTDTEMDAIQYMADEYGMRIARIAADCVWMELRDGSMVKYTLKRQ